MTQPQQVETFFPARTRLIDRNVEMGMITEAINSKNPSAIFFIGEGGIGKTRLLEEIQNQRDLLASRGIRCSELIDLYHPVYHNPDNVQNHIADQIDPQNRFFQDYRTLREAFISAEDKGVDRGKLAELADKRDGQFLEDYQALVDISKARLLLIFDTTEQIQHESDVVQALCGLQTETLAIHTWLTNQAPLLPNTVVLLAGRPRPEIEAQIQEGFLKKGWDFKPRNLETFEHDDAFAYIAALLQDQPLPEALSADQKNWLFEITEGKPIRLALALQFIHYHGIDELRVKKERGDALDEILIEHLFGLPGEYGDAMHYMLLARNGMDARLLAHLTGWEEEKIGRYFHDMQNNILFKSRGSSLFLHDELYELHDRYFRDDPRTARGYATLASYYQALLMQKLPYREQLDLRVQALYYELQQHLEQGYQLFSVWDEQTIWLHFKSVDLRMRDEMLKFTNRYLRPDSEFYDKRMAEQVDAQTIDADNAIRCIEREINDGNNHQAIRFGETILSSPEPAFADRVARDNLYRARVLYGWAEAALYAGSSDTARQHLQEVIRLLDAYQPATQEQKFWKARTLGRAYNRFGYYHRIHGYYAKSIPYYRKAVTEFRQVKLDYMLAQTLTNLAYILAQTGDTETALEHVQSALRIWEKYGLSYRKALTLSALSRILVEANKPIAARKEIEEAWAIVQQINDSQAMLLLIISDGRALRKQGNLWKDELAMYSRKDADGYLQQGENKLKEAEAMVGDKGNPLYRWEIYNELGSLFCDWAWLHRSSGNRILASTCYFNSIKYQEQALNIVRPLDMPFQIADSLDDLAQAHGDRAFFLLTENRPAEANEELRKAEQTLAEAEATLPDVYRRYGKTGNLHTGALKMQESSQTGNPEEGAPFWLVLAKANLWRGVWKFRMLEHDERLSLETNPKEVEQATEYLLTSQVFFKRYGENTPQIDRNMRYLSGYMAAVNATFEWMEAQIVKVENKYKTPLPLVRMRMQNKLGF